LEHANGGIVIRWFNREHHDGAFIMHGVVPVVICFIVICMEVQTWSWPGPMLPRLVLSLAFLSFMLLIVGAGLASLLRKPKDTVIVLTDDTLRYDPGFAPSLTERRGGSWMALRTPRVRTFKRREIGIIGEEPRGPFGCPVSLDLGSSVLMVGADFDEAECHWLSTVLRRWKDAGTAGWR
jgi:hypothetical protein